jgi:hypothetical protein
MCSVWLSRYPGNYKLTLETKKDLKNKEERAKRNNKSCGSSRLQGLNVMLWSDFSFFCFFVARDFPNLAYITGRPNQHHPPAEEPSFVMGSIYNTLVTMYNYGLIKPAQEEGSTM